MSVRVIALCAAAALVLAIGVHLFVQVHASPASAAVSSRASSRDSVATAPSGDDPGSAASAVHNSGTSARPELAAAPDKPDTGDVTAHIRTTHATVRPAGEEAPPEDDDGSGRKHKVLGFQRPDKDGKGDQKREAEMLEANKAYDRGDTDEARDIAKRIVTAEPGNIRMLRILVSTSCIDGDTATAKQYYGSLPKGDQNQMQTRCARYGISFTDGSQ